MPAWGFCACEDPSQVHTCARGNTPRRLQGQRVPAPQFRRGKACNRGAGSADDALSPGPLTEAFPPSVLTFAFPALGPGPGSESCCVSEDPAPPACSVVRLFGNSAKTHVLFSFHS
ncbi:unnamed protein product [Rangifer tarandus platyrhynchus]|uniref:Uncharacterized protein n=1 Tax=Rangifer tarandus platyrhynchus TaxID=3082113 RepID=A0AC59ZWW5_RANTA